MRSHGQSLSILASGKEDVCVIKYHAVENDDNDEHGGDNDPFSLGVENIYKNPFTLLRDIEIRPLIEKVSKLLVKLKI